MNSFLVLYSTNEQFKWIQSIKISFAKLLNAKTPAKSPSPNYTPLGHNLDFHFVINSRGVLFGHSRELDLGQGTSSSIPPLQIHNIAHIL